MSNTMTLDELIAVFERQQEGYDTYDGRRVGIGWAINCIREHRPALEAGMREPWVPNQGCGEDFVGLVHGVWIDERRHYHCWYNTSSEVPLTTSSGYEGRVEATMRLLGLSHSDGYLGEALAAAPEPIPDPLAALEELRNEPLMRQFVLTVVENGLRITNDARGELNIRLLTGQRAQEKLAALEKWAQEKIQEYTRKHGEFSTPTTYLGMAEGIAEFLAHIRALRGKEADGETH